ncbi:MAG: ABC transporter permease [Bacilli bacterium]|nr:ABC transporter permease [Bacilli bacterium]
MNNNSIIVTIKKEIRSILRDKKTLITLLIFPILIPTMIFLYAYMYDSQNKDEFYTIAMDYKLNNTEKSLLHECHLKPKYYKDLSSMKKAYSKGKVSSYISYKKESKKYMIYTNKDSEEGMYVANYITAYLDSYNNYLAKLYLIGEDVNVDKAYNNFSYEIKNLKGENFILNMIFSISFTYIIMSIVLAATNMATSATAVEKENGTLETILTFPVKASELITGKYLATTITSLIASLIGLVLTIISIAIAASSFDLFKTISFSISSLTIIIGIITCIAASLFISGMAILITSFAKTYKEAQSSSQVLSIITIIPMLISMMDIDISIKYYLIPIANYVQLLMDIFAGNFNYINISIVFISSIIYVVIVIKYITIQYKSEKVLFGN